MGFLRNTIALAFVATLLFYFVSVGEMDENQQWITIGVMITLGLVYILSGSPSFELPTPPTAATKVAAKEAVEVAQSDANEVQEEAAATPSPATTRCRSRSVKLQNPRSQRSTTCSYGASNRRQR